jgi:hypothetical protein
MFASNDNKTKQHRTGAQVKPKPARTQIRNKSQNRKPTSRQTKLTPVGRLISLVLILMIGAIAGAAGAAATRPHAQAWRCITVRPGETLWGIASRNRSADTRDVVYRIQEENRLWSGAPQAGSAIWIPNEGNLDGLALTDPSACAPAA